MSERSDGEGAEQNPSADGGRASLKAATQHLPVTDSPPLSPGGASSEAEPRRGGDLVAWTAPAARPRFRLRPRYKRRAALAASIFIAAMFGATAGGFVVRNMAGADHQSAVMREENKSMAQSIAHLAKQVAGLKTGLAEAKKAAHAQIVKLAERVERAPTAEVTGSIPVSSKQTPGKPSPAQTATEAVPLPRAAPRIASAEAPPAIASAESRPTIVPSWSVRGMRRGYLYVEGHGDVFRVVPGAVLPELGRVEAVGRQDGRWVVVTPKGLIMSQRLSRRFPDRARWGGLDF